MDPLQIGKRSIELDYRIGCGAFANVFKGKLLPYGQLVAVKIWKDDDYAEAYKDAQKMCGLVHPNVVQTIGLTTTHPPWVIMEYMVHGDLKNYLDNYGGSITAPQMIKYAYGIAKGMRYLHHELDPYMTHKDLAARNCLLGYDWTVKVADLGCWGDGYSDVYYQYQYNDQERPAPIRWMAPECVPNPYHSSIFSRKNDVWAYGVCLFEIWSKGSTPYEGYSTERIFNGFEDDEHFNPLTCARVDARKHVRAIINECFSRNSEDRPNFKQLVSHWEHYEEYIIVN